MAMGALGGGGGVEQHGGRDDEGEENEASRQRQGKAGDAVIAAAARWERVAVRREEHLGARRAGQVEDGGTRKHGLYGCVVWSLAWRELL